MKQQQAQTLNDLERSRDYVFDLFDRSARYELKIALRLIGREIKRIKQLIGTEGRSANQGNAWSHKDDEFLQRHCKIPTRSKSEAKQVLKLCAEHLKRTEFETYNRIRTLGLIDKLRAWGKESEPGWDTLRKRVDEPALPGARAEAYQGFRVVR